jgi:hypothetical protein
MRIKVLPLEPWMKYSDVEECAPKTIPLVFNRDGYYCIGESCWFELNGIARLYEANSFKYDLSVLNHTLLSKKEEAALKILVKNKIANKQMKKLYFFDQECKALHETVRLARLGSYGLRKRLKIFKSRRIK